VDNDTALQPSVEGQFYKSPNTGRQNTFRSPRAPEKKSLQSDAPQENPLLRNIEPHRSGETSVSLLRNDGKVSRRPSPESNPGNSSLNSTTKNFGNASYKEKYWTSTKKEAVAPEPASTDLKQGPNEVLPDAIVVKPPSIFIKQNPRGSRNSSSVRRSFTPESLLEKIARYQVTEKRRSKSPERSNVPTCAGVLNLILDNPRLSISKPHSTSTDSAADASKVISRVHRPKALSDMMDSGLSAAGTPMGISRVNRNKALSAESKLGAYPHVDVLNQELIKSTLRRNSSDSALSRSSHRTSGIQSINSVQNTSRRSSEGSKPNQLVFSHLDHHFTRISSASDDMSQLLCQTLLSQSNSPKTTSRRNSDASKSKQLFFSRLEQHGTRHIIGGREPASKDLDANSETGSACTANHVRTISPYNFKQCTSHNNFMELDKYDSRNGLDTDPEQINATTS